MRDHLKLKIRRIRWRIRGIRAVAWGSRLLFWLLVLACGLVVLERLLALGFDLWPMILWILCAGLVAGGAFGAFRRVTSFDAALLADERLKLRERLSSALVLPRGEEPMVRALHADAQDHAHRLRPRDAAPFSVPRRLRLLPVPAAALLMLGLFLPQMDLFGSRSRRQEVQAERTQIEQQAARLETIERTVVAAQEVQPATAVARLFEQIKKISEELKKEQLDRTQALAKVSTLSDKMEEQRRSFQEKIGVTRGMYSPQEFGQLRDFARSLSDHEYGKASGELKKLAEDLKAGNLTDTQKASLAAELEKMAALARDNPELGKALADVARSLRADDIGAMNLAFDDVVASLAELEDLLEQLALLDEMLLDVNLRKLALAGKVLSCTACQGCGRCGACGGSGKCPGCGGSGRDGQGNSCPVCGGSGVCPFCRGGGMCAGCGGCGLCSGVGMGGGRGRGPRPTDDSVLTSFQDTRISGRLQPGKILAAIRVKGQQVRGESAVEVVDAFRELRQTTEQALARESIPIGMKDRVKDYFDAIAPYVSATAPVEGEATQRGPDHP